MPLISPFRGLLPTPDRAGSVLAPPYDVLSSGEARQRAQARPDSFLHVSKAEIDLPDSVDPYDTRVYERATVNFERLVEEGVLRQDRQPAYYAYRLEDGASEQTGLVLLASLEAYRHGRIKRHELTRPDKELDRTRHIEALGAQTGPAMLAYPAAPEVDRILGSATLGKPHITAQADDGVRHCLWRLDEPGVMEQLTRAFDELHALYIADGHHRIAAADRVARSRHAGESPAATEADESWFLAVAFAHHSMRILDYNRVVTDLGDLSEEGLLEGIRRQFDIHEEPGPVRPRSRGEFGLYLPGRWFRLRVRDTPPTDDPLACLDVQILSDRLLGPVLSIIDLRGDSRIEFVGGARGLPELERRVAQGMAAAFVLYPTAMQDLMAVADAGGIMPPKSTWFEPKLADGLVAYLLPEWG